MGTPFPAGIYRIKNAKAGTYLTGSAEEPSTVFGWESRPDYEYQKWDLELVEDPGKPSAYHLRNRGDARFLTTQGVGQSPKICKALEGPTRWVLTDPKSTGEYYICIRDANINVNLMYGRPQNGAVINSVEKEDIHLNRRWRLKRVGDKSADRIKFRDEIISRLPASEHAQSGESVDQGSVYPERPATHRGSVPPPDQPTGIMPLATYSIRNAVASETPLNPDPYGSAKWVLQAGRRGYLFRSKKLGTFLGYDQRTRDEQQLVTMSAEPIEWIISRAHKAYSIRPADRQDSFLGLDNGSPWGSVPRLSLSSQDGLWKQVWKFEVANS